MKKLEFLDLFNIYNYCFGYSRGYLSLGAKPPILLYYMLITETRHCNNGGPNSNDEATTDGYKN